MTPLLAWTIPPPPPRADKPPLAVPLELEVYWMDGELLVLLYRGRELLAEVPLHPVQA